MYLKTFKFIVLIFALTVIKAGAQNVTNSPYTRYGIGDINYSGIGHNIALGGTSIAENTQFFLNSVNPACNTNLMMQRFVFDLGFDVKYTQMSSSSQSQRNQNTTFKYLAGGFAVKPWWSFMFQLKPYSSVGYKSVDSTYISNSSNASEVFGYKETYYGKGGLSQVSLATAFKAFKMLSLGVEGQFLFGNLERYHDIEQVSYTYGTKDSTKVYHTNNYLIHGFNYKLGFEFEKTFISSKDSLKPALKFAVGGFLSNEAKLSTSNEMLLYTLGSQTGSYVVASDTAELGKVTLPMSYGLGFSVELFDKLMINTDYQYQNWSKFSIPGEETTTSTLGANKYYGLGMQFVASKYSSRYYKTINYRVGIHRSDTYLNMNGYNVQDQGFTFGLGFPLRSLLLNVSCDFGVRGTTEYNLYKEKYWLLHFNVTAHDVWFVKRKFQ